MGYLSKGYHTVCLSPVFSVILYLVAIFTGWLYQAMLFAGMQIAVISVQVYGIGLCLVGYRKNESISFSKPLNILLLLWGGLVVSVFGIPPSFFLFKFWDYMVYAARAFKGIVGIVTGLIFTINTYVKKNTKPELEQSQIEKKLKSSSIC